MIKKWNDFIREFIEAPSAIDSKMQELKDLVDGISHGENLIYEWENKEDHQLYVNFSVGELSVRYEFDIDDLMVTKIVGGEVDFSEKVDSVDEGLDAIEKDIYLILGVSENNYESMLSYVRLYAFSEFSVEKAKNTKDAKYLKRKYKKDWEADYDKRSCKRIKTKKSAATIAYQKKFGDK
jgi:hypothetical protein